MLGFVTETRNISTRMIEPFLVMENQDETTTAGNDLATDNVTAAQDISLWYDNEGFILNVMEILKSTQRV